MEYSSEILQLKRVIIVLTLLVLTIGCGFALLPTFRNINAPPEANVLPARQLTTHEMGALPAPQVASFTDYLATIGTTGVQGNNSTCFSYPEGIATDRAGFVYVTDLTNYRVQIFSTAGNYLYTLGTTGQSGADNAHFGQPYDVAVNSTGYIYVTDFSNNRVQIFTPAWDYLTTISAGLNGPLGVAVDSNDFVYVMDQGHNLVKVFDNALHPMPSIGSGGGAGNGYFFGAEGIAVNNTGYVYVADTDNERVQVFNSAGTFQYAIGVTGVTGSDNGHFNLPTWVTVNSTGYVFVGDHSNHRVQVFDPAGNYQYTIGVTGVPGALNNHFNLPQGVAVNGSGQLYVADSSNFRVQIFGCQMPTNPAITINNGAVYTGSTSVTLILSAAHADQMCFSNDGVTFSAWEPFATVKSWTLTGGQGEKTVYFQVRNGPYVTMLTSASISYAFPLTGLSIAINDGAATTATRSVVLELSASGATQMCFSNDGIAWSAWEPYTTIKAWALAGGLGPQTVYVKVTNGTDSTIASANITLTTVPASTSQAEIPSWAWIVITAGVAEAVAVIVAVIVLAKRGGARGVPPSSKPLRDTAGIPENAPLPPSEDE